MTARRSRGDGGLYWSESRGRWIAEVTVGFSPAGKRIVRKASGRSKTEAQRKLKEILRDQDDGFAVAPRGYSVADAVNDWLTYGLSNRSQATRDKYKFLADGHVIPALGARKLVDLTADEVDRWLAAKAKELSTSSLRNIRSILKRAIDRAQARDKVRRNVVLLSETPTGRTGRPSKALTLAQAEALLEAAADSTLHAYIVLSMLVGARTEELRALTWSHVDLAGNPDANPPVPPTLMVWRSARAGGDTKTRKSRRTLALPRRCVVALTEHRRAQAAVRLAAGSSWQDLDLVFASAVGTQLDAHNVRRAFRRVVKAAGLEPTEWTPRELRHSFVSLLSDAGVPLENISRLVGHSGSTVTELVYRKQIRPVIADGAEAMDRIFADPRRPASEPGV
ncbi:site-specific integrase [Sporichthya polymorpha]|uniref:site-specific integrase n=1 Tax=Sporichthya polymorpha TaxID=35751 RepID=UPI00037AF15A|nr:site-specific integrase [Sporichthya polymorpha]